MKYGKLSRKDIETLERLAETPEGKAALTEFVEKQKEARKAYKRYVKLIDEKEKSPNEIRSAFIEKCKRYITKHGNGAEFVELEGGWFASRLLTYGISNTKGVSNEYIQKANALAWLLRDYDFVDETKNAPQPNEAVIGSKVEWGVKEYKVVESGRDTITNSVCSEASDIAKKGVIVCDTKAQYKEEKK